MFLSFVLSAWWLLEDLPGITEKLYSDCVLHIAGAAEEQGEQNSFVHLSHVDVKIGGLS